VYRAYHEYHVNSIDFRELSSVIVLISRVSKKTKLKKCESINKFYEKKAN